MTEIYSIYSPETEQAMKKDFQKYREKRATAQKRLHVLLSDFVSEGWSPYDIKFWLEGVLYYGWHMNDERYHKAVHNVGPGSEHEYAEKKASGGEENASQD